MLDCNNYWQKSLSKLQTSTTFHPKHWGMCVIIFNNMSTTHIFFKSKKCGFKNHWIKRPASRIFVCDTAARCGRQAFSWKQQVECRNTYILYKGFFLDSTSTNVSALENIASKTDFHFFIWSVFVSFKLS